MASRPQEFVGDVAASLNDVYREPMCIGLAMVRAAAVEVIAVAGVTRSREPTNGVAWGPEPVRPVLSPCLQRYGTDRGGLVRARPHDARLTRGLRWLTLHMPARLGAPLAGALQ